MEVLKVLLWRKSRARALRRDYVLEVSMVSGFYFSVI
jgi:hypothetical protein